MAATACTASASLAPWATYTDTTANVYTWARATGSSGTHTDSFRSRYAGGAVTPQLQNYTRFAPATVAWDDVGTLPDDSCGTALRTTASAQTNANWREISGSMRQTFKCITYGANTESTFARSNQKFSFDLASTTRVRFDAMTFVTFPESILDSTVFRIRLFDASDTPVLRLTLTGDDLIGTGDRATNRVVQEVPAGSYRFQIDHLTRLESTFSVDEPLDVRQRSDLAWSLRFKKPATPEIQQLRAIPAPGSLALVATLGLLAARRRH